MHKEAAEGGRTKSVTVRPFRLKGRWIVDIVSRKNITKKNIVLFTTKESNDPSHRVLQHQHEHRCLVCSRHLFYFRRLEVGVGIRKCGRLGGVTRELFHEMMVSGSEKRVVSLETTQ